MMLLYLRANALVVICSRLNYCNSLFRSLSKINPRIKMYLQIYTGFPNILFHIFVLTVILTALVTVRGLKISLLYQSSSLLLISLSDYRFAFDAATVSNALVVKVSTSTSLASFRKQLEAYLYTEVFLPSS